MATYSGQIRRGLPRHPGAGSWPAGGAIPDEAPSSTTVIPATVNPSTISPTTAITSSVEVTPVIRQGLPRVPGGAPWPSAGVSTANPPVVQRTSALTADATEQICHTTVETGHEARHAAEPLSDPIVAPVTASVMDESAPTLGDPGERVAVRRGLPRAEGGTPWPAAGFAPASPSPSAPAAPAANAAVETPIPIVSEAPTVSGSPKALPLQHKEAAKVSTTAPTPPSLPAATPPQLAPESSSTAARSERQPRMIGSRSLSQLIKLVIWGTVGVIVAAAIVVLAARGVTTLPGVPEFLKRYPGEYHLPEVAELGFPAWARWTHFLNFFLMILIIRSGWQVRTQQKPPAFWTPKKGGKKISINLWLHTSLDVLWLLNGLAFVVLLFISGHWVRIVPTSWEVFPNAASAMLQYLTLDWPVENGWVNYNSLQQIMYFLVVFVAAPLAAISGVRMSEWWPANAARLNKVYPAPLARAIHLPTMLFFVLFIIIHVFLVFSTGALRNLNHMFAGTDVVNWTGFWFFAGGLLVTVAVVFAARPLVLAPIASLAGKVSNR